MSANPDGQKMPRAERYAQVKALRDQGLLLREIAEVLGISKSTASAVLLDPTGERDRARKQVYARPCIDCGKMLNPNGRHDTTGRCGRCFGAQQRRDTRRWVIDSMREWEELFGVPPVVTDWNTAHAHNVGESWRADRHAATGRPWPSVTVVQTNFGSWRAGLAAAGYDGFAPGCYGREGEYIDTDGAEAERLYRDGWSSTEIAHKLGLPSATVLHRLHRRGVPLRTPEETKALMVERRPYRKPGRAVAA